MKYVGWLTLAGFIATIIIANWLVSTFGPVPVGFGLMAPAGVFVAGLAFTLRDIAQRQAGRGPVLIAIVVGAAISAIVAEPVFAVASAVAFGASELADFVVYTPLRKRGWVVAVASSNAVGLVIDSILFLWLAFGSLAFLPGQIFAKAAITLGTIAILLPVQRRLSLA